MTQEKDNNLNEDPEFGVYSTYSSPQEYQSEAAALMEARLRRMRNVSKYDIVRAKLLQLKLQMQAFINQPAYESQYFFADFLKQYIEAMYSKKAIFATDIGITPVKLSQVLNQHRAPQDEFMMKLMIHSEKVYENVCDFQKELWYKVYFHEKLYKTMATAHIWQSKFEDEVIVSEPIPKYEKKKK